MWIYLKFLRVFDIGLIIKRCCPRIGLKKQPSGGFKVKNWVNQIHWIKDECQPGSNGWMCTKAHDKLSWKRWEKWDNEMETHWGSEKSRAVRTQDDPHPLPETGYKSISSHSIIQPDLCGERKPTSPPKWPIWVFSDLSPLPRPCQVSANMGCFRTFEQMINAAALSVRKQLNSSRLWDDIFSESEPF